MAERPTLLGVRAYARRRGCSHTAVMKAIRTGRLRDSITLDDGGRSWIEPELADLEWEERTDGVKAAATVALQQQAPPETPKPERGLFGPLEREGRPATGKQAGLIEAQARKIQAEAQLKELELSERRGELCRVDAVQREQFALSRRLRDAILAVPARCAEELQAAESSHQVREILRRELETAIEEVRDDARRRAR